MAKTIDLRRHFKNDGDVLTAEGVDAATKAGKALTTRYQLAVSSGAQRATQAVACLLAGHDQAVAGGVIVDPGLRSGREARWIELINEAGGDDLEAIRALDPGFVSSEATALSERAAPGLRRPRQWRRSARRRPQPTNEAAVLGLTGEVITPLPKGAGVRIVADRGRFSVTPLG
jgi:broad specificity phosphatase PhoE